jgi:hypothetical protein
LDRDYFVAHPRYDLSLGPSGLLSAFLAAGRKNDARYSQKQHQTTDARAVMPCHFELRTSVIK